MNVEGVSSMFGVVHGARMFCWSLGAAAGMDIQCSLCCERQQSHALSRSRFELNPEPLGGCRARHERIIPFGKPD